MEVSRRAKKRLAAAAAIVVLFFILTNPTYHTGPAGGVNGTSDYYDVYYGNRTAGLTESWVELHSPTDLFAYYYCTERAGLQVGAFVLGFVGEEGIASENGTADETGAIGEGGTVLGNGDGNSSDGNTSAGSSGGNTYLAKIPDCFGIISPIPATGELDPYGTGLRVCYGLRLTETRSCAY